LRCFPVTIQLIKQANKGNVAAIKEIADRLDGKVPQALVTDEGTDLIIQVIQYTTGQVSTIAQPTCIDITPSNQATEPVSECIQSETHKP